eukprot:scaffold267521_cov24-Prasinocladus_malaysianus.AAC.1
MSIATASQLQGNGVSRAGKSKAGPTSVPAHMQIKLPWTRQEGVCHKHQTTPAAHTKDSCRRQSFKSDQ